MGQEEISNRTCDRSDALHFASLVLGRPIILLLGKSIGMVLDARGFCTSRRSGSGATRIWSFRFCHAGDDDGGVYQYLMKGSQMKWLQSLRNGLLFMGCLFFITLPYPAAATNPGMQKIAPTKHDTSPQRHKSSPDNKNKEAGNLSKSHCCGKSPCKDGTDKYACCGNGKCNIFCCNCDGGCREAHNKTECDNQCKKQASLCSSGCTISCSNAPSDSCGLMCDAQCVKEEQSCKKKCDSQYPSSAGARNERSSALRLFNKYDTNKDGHLSPKEFQKLVNKEYKGRDHQAEFHEMDKNQDGRISRQEACGASPKRARR